MRLRTSLLLATTLLLVAAVVAAVTVSGPPSAGSIATAPTGDAVAPEASPDPAVAPTAEPTPSPTPAPAPPPVPEGREDLQARLAALVNDPLLSVAEGSVAVAVLDGYGRPVLEHRSDVPMLPASTMKLVTAAAALRTFGADHRFVTRVETTQPVTQNGTVVGDLVLVGTGDPVLGTPAYQEVIYPARPRTRLEDLADAIVASGVQRVTGAVVGDGTAFGGESTARGWPDRYLADLDARHISALTVDAGIGYDLAGTPDLRDLRAELDEDPARLAAQALWRMLVERGVTVEAGARSATEPTAGGEVLARVESQPLEDLLTHMVKRSDNQVADTLFRTVAAARTGIGGWNAGALSARAVLGGLGIDGRGLVFADGSGLSREDRLTAGVLAHLDQQMASSEDAGVWARLMAVAGQEGTLRRRLRGTLAEGRFLGKTGTLDDVKSVAGTIVGPGDGRYHLAVITNDVRGRDQTIARVLMDELVLMLGEDLFGCRRGPVPVDPTETPTPDASPSPGPVAPFVAPYELSCPGGAVPGGAERGSVARSFRGR